MSAPSGGTGRSCKVGSRSRKREWRQLKQVSIFKKPSDLGGFFLKRGVGVGPSASSPPPLFLLSFLYYGQGSLWNEEVTLVADG